MVRTPAREPKKGTSLLLLAHLPPHSPLGEGLVVDVDIELGRISSELLAQLAAYLLAAVGSKALLGRALLGRVEIQDHVTGLPLAPLVDMSLRGALDVLDPQLVADLLLADDRLGLTAAVAGARSGQRLVGRQRGRELR